MKDNINPDHYKQGIYGISTIKKRGNRMEIQRLIVDKKPNDCMACVISKLKICGEPYSVHMSSGAVYMGNRPDDRCCIKESGK